MLPFQGADRYSGFATQGFAIGFILYMAFSQGYKGDNGCLVSP